MNCIHENVEIDDGEKVCTCCGTIFGCVIDEGAEWRNYESTEKDSSRTGTMINELLPDTSYGSVIMRKRFNKPSEEEKILQKLSAWAYSGHGERSWMGIFDSIQATAFRFGLTKAISMDACGLFKHVPESQKTRGETRRALMSAAVFTACRQNGATRSHQECAQMFLVSIHSLCKALMKFSNEASSVLSTQLGIAERMCAELQLTDKERDAIVLMLNSLPEMEHTPKTVVAGVISHIIGGQIPKVSSVSGVSNVSIRKMVEKLRSREVGNVESI